MVVGIVIVSVTIVLAELLYDEQVDIEQTYLSSIVSVLCNEISVINHDIEDGDMLDTDQTENDDA
jgi:hypothetical protein